MEHSQTDKKAKLFRDTVTYRSMVGLGIDVSHLEDYKRPVPVRDLIRAETDQARREHIAWVESMKSEFICDRCKNHVQISRKPLVDGAFVCIEKTREFFNSPPFKVWICSKSVPVVEGEQIVECELFEQSETINE